MAAERGGRFRHVAAQARHDPGLEHRGRRHDAAVDRLARESPRSRCRPDCDRPRRRTSAGSSARSPDRAPHAGLALDADEGGEAFSSNAASGVTDEGRLLSGPTRRARGRPRPIIATISRWISFTPPPKVLIWQWRHSRSTSPRSTRPASPLHGSGHAEHLEQQPIHLDQRLGAVDLGGRGARGVHLALLELPGHAPVHHLHRLEAGEGLGEAGLHPGLLRDGPPVLGLGLARPLDGVVEQLVGEPLKAASPMRSWLSWSVMSFQPAFSFATSMSTGTRTFS